ncbi:bifunctional phosphopantothenoylcysteine decarboxylase/phosphopantothenate--cysteine ligase CoaBC [Corynebacterium glucuronolyticum]|uniref:Coenzyme A biosynthesis bifunctional protein CoaBC n=2 Tax=Corynebacterium glucuronolyticum TaxID=39791 RepID=A0AAX1L590_9CORY|nr:bifunctional phosphopantothenoylcysteine decarboxylase/phosphopantothenate--cysteine ligase CoaBC [Corynebacterium glucuronolyticum]EEI62970.1 phosphopantothenoylcysteine decarboxylase/phosphopantothenate--cysteine ligase [Corynebacterium glucuronolyticum ATCC 51866]MCT1562582.1 bifunctional phosphopantothenoylcysteine decarboxylase/phosphopantothenate--cysteine ligase CoaBC [Corynebacterium glucuronolyticum]QRP69571.1 bifunctional phosphopantothenoylcysteine decarboxylase/phosphopantothenate
MFGALLKGEFVSTSAVHRDGQESLPTPANIIVGVTGGIAAYKACQVIRDFTKMGHNVTVVPTPNALNFVGKVTFEALSGNPVTTSVFEAVDEVRHVSLGQNADLVVIVPATADFLSRLAHGRADDLLTATCLVATCPIVVAPAMHTEMWRNKAVQENVSLLRDHGVTVLDPAIGRLTGPDSGAGRLPEPQQIEQLALARLGGVEFHRNLEGIRVLISAGGTREDLDPVRYIGNRSSGKQGFALAEVAAQRGAKVTVVAASTEALPDPLTATMVHVRSARELKAAMEENMSRSDVIIMAAAVADYRPASESETKMKKGSEAERNLSSLEMTENPDILRGLVEQRDHQILVGFAAETGDSTHTPLEHGLAKTKRKGCDLLMCNEVGRNKTFGSSSNSGWLIDKAGGYKEIETASKYVVAGQILDAVATLARHHLHV